VDKLSEGMPEMWPMKMCFTVPSEWAFVNVFFSFSQFLQDILDALFNMISTESTDPLRSQLIFKALVSIMRSSLFQKCCTMYNCSSSSTMLD